MSRGFGKVSVDIYLLFGDCGYIMLKVYKRPYNKCPYINCPIHMVVMKVGCCGKVCCGKVVASQS